jgi:hypothetical protein
MILLSGLSTVFENSSRVMEYCIFTYPRTVEGLWDLFEKLGYVKPIQQGRQLIFAISVGLALLIYKNKKAEMPVSYQKFINLVYGKDLFE